ncbi:MAG TPA: sulfotransferase [Vicinamibacterales bacterium]
MPIIIGSPRSGTTLLRLMLDSHPDLAIPPETGFLVPCAGLTDQGTVSREEFLQTVTGYPAEAPGWDDFQISRDTFRTALRTIEPFTLPDGIRAFYRLYAARFGKSRWGDKTPLYCMHVQSIEALLPEAHFIHIIRDGRDVALSLRPMWFAPGRDIETLARHWRQCVTTGRQQGSRCPRYMEVRYEQLVEDCGTVLAGICEFLDLGFDDRMLRYHELAPGRLREHQGRFRPDGSVVVTPEQRWVQQQRTTRPPDRSRVFAWKHAMPRDEQRRFDAVAGDLLEELGFDRT